MDEREMMLQVLHSLITERYEQCNNIALKIKNNTDQESKKTYWYNAGERQAYNFVLDTIELMQFH